MSFSSSVLGNQAPRVLGETLSIHPILSIEKEKKSWEQQIFPVNYKHTLGYLE